MSGKDILFNGKLRRCFSFEEFHSVWGEPDSSKVLQDEEPCTTIFREADGSVHPRARYLYKNGSRFEKSQSRAAIDKIMFGQGDFIIFRNITLKQHTILAEISRLFPNAAKHISIIDVQAEGKLQLIQPREDKDNITEGHINILIKGDKLHSLHWWFPC